MNTADQNIRKADDNITLYELMLALNRWKNYLLSKWKFVLVFGVVGSLLLFIYVSVKKKHYVAESTFVLQSSDNGNLAQYAGIASMVGIQLGGASSNGLFQDDNIMELYTSRLMIQKALLSYADFNGKKDLLINRFIQLNEWREKWDENPKLKNINFADYDNPGTDRVKDSVITSIVSIINKNYLTVDKAEKSAGIIDVKVTSTDELFSKNFNNRIVETVNEFYTKTNTKKSYQNLAILQHQTDSIRSALNISISQTAGALSANPNANTALLQLQVPSQKKRIDVETNKAMLEELVKNLEISKVSLRKDTPLIQMIDEPVLPLPIQGLGKLIAIIVGFFVASILTSIYLLVKYIFTGFMESERKKKETESIA